MEALAKLEMGIDQLLARLNSLKAENLRLREDMAAIAKEKQALASEIRILREAGETTERARSEALERLEALLRKIREFTSVG